MSQADFAALLPMVVVGSTSVVVMMVIAFYRDHSTTVALTLWGLLIAFAMLFAMSPMLPRQVTPLLLIDRYSFFYSGLFFVACAFVVMFSYAYFKGRPGRHEELYVLLLMATFGSAVLASSSHFASFFLGLELLSISLYALIAYQRVDEAGNEAGIKYLVLAAASSAFLLFGMALIYAQTGTMQFSGIAAAAVSFHPASLPVLFVAGLALIIIGLGFKLAVVPFHMWTPDVYEGAPAPVSAFIASISKGAVFALLLRYFLQINLHHFYPVVVILTAISIASMLIGNLLALVQNNVKRILAYSSIAHLGYALVAFLARGATAVTAVSYYFAAYFVTIIGAFGIISVLSSDQKDADQLEEYTGLAWRRPWLAGIFTLILFSLAGIPLTAGFSGKFFVIAAGANSTLWLLLVVLAISSSIGLYYYLRIVSIMYARAPDGAGGPSTVAPLSLEGGTALIAVIVLLIWLGTYPSPMLQLIKETAALLITK
jgi:NADH-quinone oxidoreductase subunit N